MRSTLAHRVVELVPTDVQATSVDSPSPSGPKSLNVGPYNKTPKNGSIDNLISVWPGVELTLEIVVPDGCQNLFPPDQITWNAPEHSVPNGTFKYKFKWTNTGIKTVTIHVGETKFEVVIDVVDVGSQSQGSALLAINPVSAATIINHGDFSLSYTNSNYPVTPRRDAIRHSLWNALCASDSWTSVQDTLRVTIAHEWNNKWGYDKFGSDDPQGGQPAFDSTMDLHNNVVGVGAVHSTPDGGGLAPDFNAIMADLNAKYSAGELYIWDGGAEESKSQGIILKSNGKKIY